MVRPLIDGGRNATTLRLLVLGGPYWFAQNAPERDSVVPLAWTVFEERMLVERQPVGSVDGHDVFVDSDLVFPPRPGTADDLVPAYDATGTVLGYRLPAIGLVPANEIDLASFDFQRELDRRGIRVIDSTQETPP